MDMKLLIGKDIQICCSMASTGVLYNDDRGHTGQYNIYSTINLQLVLISAYMCLCVYISFSALLAIWTPQFIGLR